MPEDFDVCIDLINLTFTNYKNITDVNNIINLSNNFFHFYDNCNDELLFYLAKINKDVANLINSSKCLFRVIRSDFNYSLKIIEALIEIYNSLLVIFMMNIDKCVCNFDLPKKIVERLIDEISINNQLKIKIIDYFEHYSSEKKIKVLTKFLLDTKVINVEEFINSEVKKKTIIDKNKTS